MRLSYSEQLIGLDRERRVREYGRSAKRSHLKFVTITTAVIYLAVRVAAWFYPKTVSHVWIDDVLVEVVEDAKLEAFCTVLGYVLVASLLLLFFFSMTKGRDGNHHQSPRRPLGRNPRVVDDRDGAHHHQGREWTVPFSSIAVPASSLSGGLPKKAASSTVALGAHYYQQPQQPHHQQSIRSQKELDDFLLSKELGNRKQGGEATTNSLPNNTNINVSPVAAAAGSGSGAFGSLLVGGSISARSSDGIRVQYRGGGGEQGPASGQLVDTEWVGLGIVSAERSLIKTRKWLSDLCHGLVEEIAACDRWFAERQISSFDCRHSLDEMIPLQRPFVASGVGVCVPPAAFSSSTTTTTAAAAGGGVGGGGATLRKLDALLNERQKLSGQSQNVHNFDTTLHLEQRMSLEAKLDTAGTFPPAVPLSVAERQAQRQYIIKRLRIFASQKTLASYKHNRGDADLWRDDFPNDAHLLIHVVRMCVDGFANYVKFPHQPMNAQLDLALFIGDTGEPYFYIKYRNGATDKTYATHHGMNSLFEALLIFAAIVRTYHNASYGGIWGVMDLSRTGLLNVL